MALGKQNTGGDCQSTSVCMGKTRMSWWDGTMSLSIFLMPSGMNMGRAVGPESFCCAAKGCWGRCLPWDHRMDFMASDTGGKPRANGLQLRSGEAENLPLLLAAASAHNGVI